MIFPAGHTSAVRCSVHRPPVLEASGGAPTRRCMKAVRTGTEHSLWAEADSSDTSSRGEKEGGTACGLAHPPPASFASGRESMSTKAADVLDVRLFRVRRAPSREAMPVIGVPASDSIFSLLAAAWKVAEHAMTLKSGSVEGSGRTSSWQPEPQRPNARGVLPESVSHDQGWNRDSGSSAPPASNSSYVPTLQEDGGRAQAGPDGRNAAGYEGSIPWRGTTRRGR